MYQQNHTLRQMYPRVCYLQHLNHCQTVPRVYALRIVQTKIVPDDVTFAANAIATNDNPKTMSHDRLGMLCYKINN